MVGCTYIRRGFILQMVLTLNFRQKAMVRVRGVRMGSHGKGVLERLGQESK